MRFLFTTPLFSVFLTLLSFVIGVYVHKKTNISILNPVLVSTVIIIVFLLQFKIPYDTYNQGGSFISIALEPATVLLAVPLYRQITLLKKNAIPIIISVTFGVIFGITCILVLCRVMHLDDAITKSLVGKALTTPIAVALTSKLGGIPAITVAAVCITGVFGVILSPIIFKLFKLDCKIAQGISLGTAAHALGTTKAFELGEIQGAMSSLSIGVTGIVTILIGPAIYYIVTPILDMLKL